MSNVETETLHRITSVENHGTIWAFAAEPVGDGSFVTFYSDHRPARHMMDGLVEEAAEAFKESKLPLAGITLLQAVSCLDLTLIPDDTMGMQMPTVQVVGFSLERAKKLCGGV